MNYGKMVLVGSAVAGLLSVISVTGAVADDARAARTVATCTGGAQELVNVRTSNSPVTSASTTFVAIPETTVAGGASGAAGDFDTYIVTFAGEANNINAGSWTARALVSVNGGAFTVINPTGPNTFHSGKKANNNSMTWCIRVAAVTSTTFRIEWAATVATTTAQIDDYTTVVQRSN
jgi:hypothetical protein